jgi:tetratricopeptide (TPR) repeat protein
VSVLLILIGFLIEFFLNLYTAPILLQQQPPEAGLVLSFIGINIVASLIFAFGMYLFSRKLPSPVNWSILSFLISIAFVSIGMVGMVAINIWIKRAKRLKLGVYEAYEQYITFEYAEAPKYWREDALIEKMYEEMEVRPLVDVLSEEDYLLRRGAVDIIDRLGKQDAVKILQSGLVDGNVEVRFHVASELSKIETEYSDNILSAQKEVDKNPDSEDSHRILANAYAEYCRSGILDEISRDYYLGLAVEEYKRSLEISPPQINTRITLSQLLLEKGNIQEAEKNLKQVVSEAPDNYQAHIELAKIYYRRRDFQKVSQELKKSKSIVPEKTGLVGEIVSYWSKK